MLAAFLGDAAIGTYVENTIELLGEILFQDPPGLLRYAFDRVSSIFIHQRILTSR